MSDITKKPQMMPDFGIGDALGRIAPPQVPSLPFDRSLLTHIYHGMKLGRQRKFYEDEAGIAASQNSMVKSRVEAMITVMTAGDRFEEQRRRYQHNIVMMNMAEYKEQQECIKKEAEAREATASAETAELNLKIMRYTTRQEYGDAFGS